jgi:hypothetical protein
MGAKPTIPGRLEKRSKRRFDERQFRRQAGIKQDRFGDLLVRIAVNFNDRRQQGSVFAASERSMDCFIPCAVSLL